MKQKLPITRAFCVELGRVVTITEARREFLSQIAPVDAFTFRCDDPACSTKAVLITGVNYRFAAEEKVKFKAAHFRHGNEHNIGCGWLWDSASNQSIQPLLSDDGITISRLARSKSHDLITIFDPAISQKPRVRPVVSAEIEPTGEPDEPNKTIWSGSSKINSRDGETRTNDIERLVESFLEARSNLDQESFRKLPLKIKGKTPTTYWQYFREIKSCESGPGTGIVYGRARFYKDYAMGFKLTFIEKINRQYVYLYVSSQQISDYRYGQYLRTVVNSMRDSRRDATVYFLGEVKLIPERNQFDVVLQHLSHLCIMLAPNSSP